MKKANIKHTRFSRCSANCAFISRCRLVECGFLLFKFRL